MTILNLEYLLHPESVVLIGASNRTGSLGNVVMQNLINSGFAGPVIPVNPGYSKISGIRAYPDVDSLPDVPDLAVICTPAETVPGLITQLGARGTRAAVVLSAGFREEIDGVTLEQRLQDAAKPYGIRILGPNCVGLQTPGIGLNASFAHVDVEPGSLAMVSQSGALCTTLLDWARSHGIGFSHFISLGDSADVDFGDLLDYLRTNTDTDGILLYIESIKDARKFMSAARAIAPNKPVILIKAGRYAEGAKAAATHTGALAGRDDVFDAAIRRTGMLRVETIDDLFNAAETLARAKPVHGDRLAILTNGGGPGVLATDTLIAHGGHLAEISAETFEALDGLLPTTWSRGNPVDIIGDSDAERYVRALEILLKDEGFDALLIMLVPVAVINNQEVASRIIQVLKKCRRPVFTCWMGEDSVSAGRNIFRQAKVPTYNTPNDAVKAFMHMVEYGRNQRALMETPVMTSWKGQPSVEVVSQIIDQALDEGREILSEVEAKEILAAYQIPVVETCAVKDDEQAVIAAQALGFPVAVKILSGDISHKSDVGGVALNIESEADLRQSLQQMRARVEELVPEARIDGFTVQPMVRMLKAVELIAGAVVDPVFGPAILFGQGGTAVELWRDKAIALPPLNSVLAKDLISRTRISALLRGYRDQPAANLPAIEATLIALSQLIIDHPQITELDINPLLANEEGVLALDARVRIARTKQSGIERLAIRPYQRELEERLQLKNGQKILLRPIRPEDEPEHLALFNHLDQQDIYFRFFRAIAHVKHEQMAQLTQIDYEREMAFIATTDSQDGQHETLAVARAIVGSEGSEAEFAIIVRSDLHGYGLGTLLMDKLIRYCRSRGLKRIVGYVLSNNQKMQRLAKRFGFKSTYTEEDGVKVILSLETET